MLAQCWASVADDGPTLSQHWVLWLSCSFWICVTCIRFHVCTGWLVHCLASPANFIYGRVLAKVLSHVTIMPVLLRPVNNFLGQVIGNASEGKYDTVNNSSSGEVTFQNCLISGITLFSSENSNKSQTFATGPYQRLHEARPRRVVWLWEPEQPAQCSVSWYQTISSSMVWFSLYISSP